ncbi:MAG: hypothetical protein JRI72_17795 [Deltaproteobacteria bacterium]|nr:hypothetical protein [Deltaproteobacteria bacterium]
MIGQERDPNESMFERQFREQRARKINERPGYITEILSSIDIINRKLDVIIEQKDQNKQD